MNRLILISLLVGAISIFFVVRHSRQVAPQEVTITYDTIEYRNIDPVSVVPDTLSQEPEVDSLYTFRDSVDGRWSAEVAGRNVELRSLVLLDRQEVTHTTHYEKPSWEVALKAAINPYSQWVGVGVSRSFGRVTVSLDGGYDTWSKSPYVGAQASVALWRE